MEDRDLQAREEEHSRFHDWIWYISHEGEHRWATHHLLKKNVWQDIIKTILEYPPIAMLESLKKWKVVITSVRQGYESTEEHHDYKTGTRTTYGG